MSEGIGIASASLLLGGIVRSTRASWEARLEDLEAELRSGRSMDRISRIACAAARGALEQVEPRLLPAMGVFFGSGYGTYASNLDHFEHVRKREPSSPAVFSWTQPNIPAAWISIAYGLGGEILARSDGCMAGSKAVESGIEFIGAGLSAMVLAGSVSTCDPRVVSGLGRALGAGYRAAAAEGGGFAVLGGPGPHAARLAKTAFVRHARGKGWAECAMEAGFPARPDLLVTARPGMASDLGRIEPGGRFDLGGEYGDLMEAAGPAALSAAAIAAAGGALPGKRTDARPGTVLAADCDYCRSETALFLVVGRPEGGCAAGKAGRPA